MKKKCKHDFDMKFPNNDLEWVFVCNKCGLRVNDMETASKLQGK